MTDMLEVIYLLPTRTLEETADPVVLTVMMERVEDLLQGPVTELRIRYVTNPELLDGKPALEIVARRCVPHCCYHSHDEPGTKCCLVRNATHQPGGPIRGRAQSRTAQRKASRP